MRTGQRRAKRMKRKAGSFVREAGKRILSTALVAAMIVGIVPGLGELKTVEAVGATRQMINLGAEQLTTSTQEPESNLVSAYFGKNNRGKDSKYWLFETPDSQSVSDDSILLEAMQNGGGFITFETVFNSSKKTGQSNINEWEYSDLQTFLNGSDFYGNSTIFSDLERAAILKTTLKAKSKYTVKVNSVAYSAVDVDSENYIFPLSLYESAKYHKYAGTQKSNLIFTRSADSDNTSNVYVRMNGYYYNSQATTKKTSYSPSFNLDKSAILFSSAATFDKTSALQKVTSISSTSVTWEFTLRDNKKSIKITEDSTVTRDDADDGTITVTVPYTYTDTNTALPVSQISVMLTDKAYTESDAEITYYGKLTNVSETSGTATFTLPSDYKDKTCGEDYYAYIVAERVNTSNGTDYASTPCYIQIPGAKYRINLTGGTVAAASDDDKYAAGTEITITYNESDVPAGTKFSGWTGLDSVTFATGSSASSSSVTFTMPTNSLTVAAAYAHVHDYATSWTSDASTHWYACVSADTTGCTAKKKDEVAHTAGDWIVDATATTDQAGSRHKECTVCGYKITTEAIPQIVKEPTASKDSSDSETADFTVTLSTETAGASIYYTTDGTTPVVTEQNGRFTPSGTTKLYTGAISITGDEKTAGGVSTTIKAIAVKSGMAQSETLSRIYKVTIPHTHKWSAVKYTWNSDYTECTATRTCDSAYAAVCNEQTQTEKVTLSGGGVVATVTQAQSCVADELTTYTANFNNTAFTQQVQTDVKTKDKLGHSYGAVSYAWSEDNASCTATKVCVRSTCTADMKDHTITQTVQTTSTVTQAQNCGKAEITKYTATFTADAAFTTQTKEAETKAALEHTYAEPTYEWSANATTCTAKRVCTNPNCKNEETEEATVENGKNVQTVTTKVSCTEDEISTYTASFTNTVFAQQEKTGVKTKDKLGHAFATDFTIDVEATCTKEGSKSKHCTHTGCEEKTDVTVIEKTAHTPSDWRIVTKPTTESTGRKHKVCTVCGTELETAPIDKLIVYDAQTDNVTSYTVNLDTSYKITVQADASKLTDVTVDGVAVDPSNYTVESGTPMVVTFTKEYMDSLSGGDHKFSINYTDGLAEADLKVIHVYEPAIDLVPTVDKTDAVVGDTVTFSMKATGEYLKYQWQVDKGDGTFENIEGATAESYTTDALTLSQNGWKYRCLVTNISGQKISDAVTLSVSPRTYEATTGDVTSYTVNLDTSYQITAAVDASKFTGVEVDGAVVDSGYYTVSGGSPTVVSFTQAYLDRLAAGDHSFKVKFDDGAATTSLTTIRVDEPAIAAQPVADKTTATAGETVTFSMRATGEYLQYQWQVDRGDGNYVNIEGATAESYTTDALSIAENGNKYRCVVTNISGSTISDAVTIMVKAPLYEVIENADGTYTKSDDTTYMLRANGDFVKFVSLYVDGVLVDAANYDAYEGSTVIVFKEAYLATLSVGVHDVLLTYSDGGKAETTLTIKAKDSGNNGNNGNNDNSESNNGGNNDSSDNGNNSNTSNNGNNNSNTSNNGNNNSNTSDNGNNNSNTSSNSGATTDTTAASNTTTTADSPKTGDSTPIAWLFALMLVCGCGAYMMIEYRKSGRND